MKKTLLSIVMVNVMLFFALIAIHEISHVIMGFCLGCESEKAILFDSNFNGPHTELVCNNGVNEFFVYLGGLIITSIFSLSFLLLESFEKNMSFLSLGVSIVLSSLDISFVLGSETILYPLLTFGFLLVTLGEYFVASSFIKESFSFGFLNSKKLLTEKEM